jgi:YVTN family beta-propeller protein
VTAAAHGGRANAALARARPSGGTRLAEQTLGRLPAPLEDPGASRVGSRLVLAGGLTAQDTSSSEIVGVTGARGLSLGRLPAAQHDAPAVALAGSAYVFGGGDGVHQLDHILRIDPRSGTVATVGRLPAASSDASAAEVGPAAYIVGGYTGTHWLDTIVRFQPGHRVRIVAHLPLGVRYAAVAASGKAIVIAGGTLPDNTASRAVYRYDTVSGRVKRIATLPRVTTHASAATLGGTVYVIGGRGAALGSVTAAIIAINPRTGRLTNGGRLGVARSDLAAVTVGDTIVVAGGGTAHGVTDAITALAPHTAESSGGSSANVYAADRANGLTGAARSARALVYVPNSQSNTLDVIDQHTMKVIAHYSVGQLPQHVTPSWDLRTLYVDNDLSNSLTPINPMTGRPTGRPIPVTDPYNLYFTPNGRYAIVVAEARARLDFRTAHGMRLKHSLAMPCRGVDHMDFSADGSTLLASCEFSSEMVAVNVARQRVIRVIHLPSSMPQDVKLSPDGRTYFVADMARGGIWLIDASTLRVRSFKATGAGAHGLYPSRDARDLYITNRGAGTVSVMSFATHRIRATWRIPNGTPDMGGVSIDGRILWLSGRYRSEVYAIDTRTGRLRARIRVGSGPHGLCVWPQPGRYSLGHTGILR